MFFRIPDYFHQSTMNRRILSMYRLFFCSAISFQLFTTQGFFLLLFEKSTCYPIELFQLLSVPTVDIHLYKFANSFLIILLLMAAFGFFTRLCLGLSLILFTFVVGTAIGCSRGETTYYTSWQHCIVIFNLFILLVSPRVQELNILQVLKFQKTNSTFETAPYWPIDLLKFNIIFSYFAGGIVKIKSGFEWMNGYTLQGYIVHDHLVSELPLAYAMAQNLFLMKFISIAVVFLELLLPIVLFTRKEIGWFFMFITFIAQVLAWFLIELRWMNFYGWSYLIYAIEIVFFYSMSKKVEFLNPNKTSSIARAD